MARTRLFFTGARLAKSLVLVVSLMTGSHAIAQDDPEYRLEMGAALGLATYEGDLNGKIFNNQQPLGAVVAKYKMTPRMAWTLTVGYGQLKGNSENTATWMPPTAGQTYSFTSKLWTADVRYEYNFWPFGTGREYLGARTVTPFVTFGMGLCMAKPSTTTTAMQMPIGAGVKWKIADRLNLTAQWLVHFTTSDHLDDMADPYGIVSSGLFKNTDGYSTLSVALTYDLWSRCKTCNRE